MASAANILLMKNLNLSVSELYKSEKFEVKNLYGFCSKTDLVMANIVRVWISAHFKNHNVVSVPAEETMNKINT